MLYIGCHLSASAGYLAAVETARSIGANTFAFFTRNPRGSRAKPEDPADAAAAMKALRDFGFGKLVAHGSYTMNLCTVSWRMTCVAWLHCPAISTIFTRAVMWGRGRKQASIKLRMHCGRPCSPGIL